MATIEQDAQPIEDYSLILNSNKRAVIELDSFVSSKRKTPIYSGWYCTLPINIDHDLYIIRKLPLPKGGYVVEYDGIIDLTKDLPDIIDLTTEDDCSDYNDYENQSQYDYDVDLYEHDDDMLFDGDLCDFLNEMFESENNFVHV